MTLTEEQLARIAVNKRAAEKRRREKAQEVSAEAPVCEKCSSTDVYAMYLEIFEEYICRRCAASDDDWELLNKSTVSAEYLLSDDTIRHLRHKVKDNPHRKGWAEMKLYLRRHARNESHRRWGGADELSAERARRDGQKLERELSRAVTSASGSGDGIADAENDDEQDTTTKSILTQMLKQGDVLGAVATSLGLRPAAADQQCDAAYPTSKRAKLQAYPVYRDDKEPDPGLEKAKPDAKKHNTVKASRLAGMLSAIRGSTAK